jgi:hypothetical protein
VNSCKWFIQKTQDTNDFLKKMQDIAVASLQFCTIMDYCKLGVACMQHRPGMSLSIYHMLVTCSIMICNRVVRVKSSGSQYAVVIPQHSDATTQSTWTELLRWSVLANSNGDSKRTRFRERRLGFHNFLWIRLSTQNFTTRVLFIEPIVWSTS